ncbi:MAP4K2 [Symbiodinium natans]|uniref:MAP4K2 protein n=1 Tax=Symbiodinium natans TaxID=878477 RepID=A0A812S6X9_9DINO|nr:MAP4K2 [Symbiodinium natans]
MAPLPGVHPGVLPRSLGEDPVLSALQRYREAAGSTFHPLSEVEEPDEQAPFDDLATQRFAVRSSPSASSTSNGSPKCGLRPPVLPSEFHVLEEDVRQAICGFGAHGDWRDVLPTWLSWMNPWLEPTAPDLCGGLPKGPSGHFASGGSMTMVESPRFAKEAEERITSELVTSSSSGIGIKHAGLPSPPTSQVTKDGLTRPRVRRALEAIRELPDGLRSSVFDDLVIPEGVEQVVLGPLPDCAEEGLEIGEAFADYSEGWGLGKVCQGRVGETAALVVQLRLPKPLNSGQLRRLGALLRRGAVEASPRSDLVRPIGAVMPGDGSAGVWIAWERPGGSCSTISPLPIDLKQEPTRGLSWRLSVARQLCLAVDALHRSGKVHGSLSPRNVLVATTGDVSILEAGLVDALLEVDALREHDLLGALGLQFARYTAPEGWHVPRSGGSAADIFALGLILLEVMECCGQPNPECKSLQQLSAKMLPKRGHWQPQVKSRTFYDELPSATRNTIELCFHADPSKRPSAQELLFGLAAPPESEEQLPVSFLEFKNLLYGSDASDGLKSGSTAISGSSGKSQQDLDAVNAEVAEEQAAIPLVKPPRHMSWPSGPRPELRESPSLPGDRGHVPESEKSSEKSETSKQRLQRPSRAFSADDASSDCLPLKPPLPPPPPQLCEQQAKAKVRPNPLDDVTVPSEPGPVLSPLSPGPPPPPPPPLPREKAQISGPEASPPPSCSAPSRKSRPPSPPRQMPETRPEEALQVPCRRWDMSPPPPEPPRPSQAMPIEATPMTLWQMPVLYTPRPLNVGPMTKV